MTSQAVRRVGIPLVVALVVLAAILAVMRLADSGDVAAGGPGAGGPDAGGGVTGSEAPGSPGTDAATPSVVPPEPGPASPEPGEDPDRQMSRFVSVQPGTSGTTLEVTFWGGVDTCYEYTVRAEEGERAVRLTLVERTRSKGPCIELAQQYSRTVHLHEPLGGRRVADAETGETLVPPTH